MKRENYSINKKKSRMKRFKLFLMVMGLLLGISSTVLAQQINGNFDTFEVGWNTVGEQPMGWKASNVYQTVKVIINQTKKHFRSFGKCCENGK